MEIHIVPTPNIESRIISGVCNLLNDSGTGFTFKSVAPFSIQELGNIDPIFKKRVIPELRFETLFKICDKYRSNSLINTDIFVSLLTDYRNKRNWFSAVKGKNIFVDINDWEEITRKNKIYGISYQIIENVFQSLLKLDYDKVTSKSKYIHFKTKGCVNDFCETKEDILFKIKTADICDTCLTRAKQIKIPSKILSSIQLILEFIRPKVKSFDAEPGAEPERIKISKDLKTIFIGEKKITLQPLEQCLFIFFLDKGVMPVRELRKKTEEIYRIYKKVRKSAEEDRIKRLFGTNSTTSHFDKLKSTLNKKLIKQLGKPLADYYIVESHNKTLRVRITHDYLDPRPEY